MWTGLVIIFLVYGLWILAFHIVVLRGWRLLVRRAQARPAEPQCGKCRYPIKGWSTDCCPECGTDRTEREPYVRPLHRVRVPGYALILLVMMINVCVLWIATPRWATVQSMYARLGPVAIQDSGTFEFDHIFEANRVWRFSRDGNLMVYEMSYLRGNYLPPDGSEPISIFLHVGPADYPGPEPSLYEALKSVHPSVTEKLLIAVRNEQTLDGQTIAHLMDRPVREKYSDWNRPASMLGRWMIDHYGALMLGGIILIAILQILFLIKTPNFVVPAKQT